MKCLLFLYFSNIFSLALCARQEVFKCCIHSHIYSCLSYKIMGITIQYGASY